MRYVLAVLVSTVAVATALAISEHRVHRLIPAGDNPFASSTPTPQQILGIKAGYGIGVSYKPSWVDPAAVLILGLGAAAATGLLVRR